MNKVTRRNFIFRGGGCAAAMGFLGIAAQAGGRSAQSGSAGRPLMMRPLGKTGIVLPIVNMGVMNAFSPELVKRSFEVGVRHFDTAAYYQRGQNEAMVGKALKEMGVRDQVVIGTKVFVPHEQRPRMSPADLKTFFLATAEESLKRLQTEVIDIFYAHNVQDIGYLNNPGIREALVTLKERKKARQIGFTVHQNMRELVQDAVKSGFYDVIAVAFNYSMADDRGLIDALEKAHGQGIGLVAMKTQCTQYWYREYVPSEKQSYYQGKILHTAVLKWVLRHDFITCAIPGYTTFPQLEEDISVASDLEYTPEEKAFLADRQVKLALQSYCRQCGSCLATCPKGVEIPTLMRVHLYAACYGNFAQARSTLEELPGGKRLLACTSCESCMARCVRRVPVGQRIQELKAIYA
ncbi:MAG: aldo/keto reductase [Candidatus Aminicenantes bacterium]|nr:aldo/keto reductase [Candidatus Aminicenantes bacterium]